MQENVRHLVFLLSSPRVAFLCSSFSGFGVGSKHVPALVEGQVVLVVFGVLLLRGRPARPFMHSLGRLRLSMCLLCLGDSWGSQGALRSLAYLRGETAHKTGEMAHETGEMAHETGETAHKTGEMAHETGEMAHETGEMAHETGEIARRTRGSDHPIRPGWCDAQRWLWHNDGMTVA